MSHTGAFIFSLNPSLFLSRYRPSRHHLNRTLLPLLANARRHDGLRSAEAPPIGGDAAAATVDASDAVALSVLIDNGAAVVAGTSFVRAVAATTITPGSAANLMTVPLVMTSDDVDFSLSVDSEYLFASLRNLSASDRELALSRSKSERCLAAAAAAALTNADGLCSVNSAVFGVSVDVVGDVLVLLLL